jgi:hypothetical protein
LICSVLSAGAVQAQVDTLQSSSRAAARKDAQEPNGKIAVDVTVRSHPGLTAQGLTNLPAGTPVRSVPAKALGWTRIVEPTRGWIPSETYAVRGEDEAQAMAVSPGEPADNGTGASSRREHRPDARGHRRYRAAAADGTGSRDGAAPDGQPQASALARPASTDGRPGTERSESDLMLEALTATRGESPNAARIARVVAETAKEVRRKRIEEPVVTFWKDPFVDDSEPPAMVRLHHGRRGGGAGARSVAGIAEDRSEAQAVQAESMKARREAARARAETAAARAEEAAIRAEAARVKAEQARREAAVARADALAAKREADQARADYDERPDRRRSSAGRGVAWRALSVPDENRAAPIAKRPRRERTSVVGQRLSRSTAGVAAETSGAETAADNTMVPPTPAVSAAASPPPPPEEPAPVAPAPPVAPAVAPQPSSAGYHGILVVPLN